MELQRLLRTTGGSVVLRSSLVVMAAVLLASCVSTTLTRPPESEVPGIFFDDPDLFELDDRATIRSAPDNAIAITTAHEGFRASPYNDPVQFCTVAYGHLITRKPCSKTEYEQYPQPLSKEQGIVLLRQDMRFAEIAVGRAITRELTDGQYGALCDFTFNVGAGNFRKSRLRKLINEGDFDAVPAEFRRWRRAGGKVLDGLVKRREREISLFFEGMEMPRALGTEEEAPDIDILTGRTVR